MSLKIKLTTTLFLIVMHQFSFSQSSIEKTSNQVIALSTDMEKVVEAMIVLEKDSLSITEEFYLPKGKYVIYAMSDSSSVKSPAFTLRFDGMHGEMSDKINRNIIKEGKGFKMTKDWQSNPQIIDSNFVKVDFKINDAWSTYNNASAKSEAKSRANNTGTTQYYSKHSNGSKIRITFSIDPANKSADKTGYMKVIVFQK